MENCCEDRIVAGLRVLVAFATIIPLARNSWLYVYIVYTLQLYMQWFILALCKQGSVVTAKKTEEGH